MVHGHETLEDVLMLLPDSIRDYALKLPSVQASDDVYAFAKTIEVWAREHGELLALIPIDVLLGVLTEVQPSLDLSTIRNPDGRTRKYAKSADTPTTFTDTIGDLLVRTERKRVVVSVPNRGKVELQPQIGFTFYLFLTHFTEQVSDAFLDMQTLLQKSSLPDTAENQTCIRNRISTLRANLSTLVPGLERCFPSIRGRGYVFDRALAEEVVSACLSPSD